MRVLVIGEGCREDALIKALGQDPSVQAVYTLSQNQSSYPLVQYVPFQLNQQINQQINQQALVEHLRKEHISLIVIGPEQPLVDGVGDFLRKEGFYVFGASQSASLLESSKLFAKQFMKKNHIPTAHYKKVCSTKQVLEEAQHFTPPYVLKADGLAGGKGVFLCSNLKELEKKAKMLFEKKVFGSAGSKALLEEFQSGEEVSVFVLTNGVDYQILPLARDYKALCNGGVGPNTGGMGAIAPIKLKTQWMDKIEKHVIKPTILGLKNEDRPYQGVLYFGLMLKQNTKKVVVLEYNVRFGDPEAQVLLPLLDGYWGQVFYAVSKGLCPKLTWKKNTHCACVVLATAGYPEKPIKGHTIEGDLTHSNKKNSYFLYGAIKQNSVKQSLEKKRSIVKKANRASKNIAQDKKGCYITSGGRVLNAVAVASKKKDVVTKVYKQVQKVSWSRVQYRTDIGQ